MKKRICELIQSPIDMLPIKTIYDLLCLYPIIAEYVIILLALFVFFLLLLVPYIFEDYEAFIIGIPILVICKYFQRKIFALPIFTHP